jgi:hypothetical protein
MDSLTQGSGTKVDEQTDCCVRQLEVGQKLLAVNRRQPFYRFEFHEDSTVNPEVNAKPSIENHPRVFKSEG